MVDYTPFPKQLLNFQRTPAVKMFGEDVSLASMTRERLKLPHCLLRWTSSATLICLLSHSRQGSGNLAPSSKSTQAVRKTPGAAIVYRSVVASQTQRVGLGRSCLK